MDELAVGLDVRCSWPVSRVELTSDGSATLRAADGRSV